jgi:lysozyme
MSIENLMFKHMARIIAVIYVVLLLITLSQGISFAFVLSSDDFVSMHETSETLKYKVFYDRVRLLPPQHKVFDRLDSTNLARQQKAIQARNQVISQAAEVLKIHEGFRPKAYRCSSGQLTVGYGTVAKKANTTVTEAQATQLLIRQLNKDWDLLTNKFEWFQDLDPNRQMALLNLSYNMGFDKLLKFKKMLTSLEKGDYQQASVQLLQSSSKGKSKYYQQVGVRAEHVSKAIASGTWDMKEIKSYYYV